MARTESRQRTIPRHCWHCFHQSTLSDCLDNVFNMCLLKLTLQINESRLCHRAPAVLELYIASH